MYQINVVRNNDVIADYIECNIIHQYIPVNIQNKENRYTFHQSPYGRDER